MLILAFKNAGDAAPQHRTLARLLAAGRGRILQDAVRQAREGQRLQPDPARAL